MQPFILYERDGAVVTLTMNRPDERNALTTAAQFAEFPQVCERIRRDTEVCAVILTGAGPVFCAGGNVMDMRDKAGLFEGNPHAIRNRYRSGIQRIPLAMYELEVPTIAAEPGLGFPSFARDNRLAHARIRPVPRVQPLFCERDHDEQICAST